MKNTLVILLIMISSMGLSQENFLAGTHWKAGNHIFENKDQESYIFTQPIDTDDWSYHWGYSIDFSEDGTFGTSYSAPCGNDCFTHVSGTYSFIDENLVVIYVESISRNGFCSLESEEPKAVYGKYRVSLTDDGTTLTFTKEN